MTTDAAAAGVPFVDVVIAIHDPSRRLDRALASVLDGEDDVRVTVVCHGISAESVSSQVPAEGMDRVRLIEFSDGIASPEGPFNHGLDLATGIYVMIMGSDDFLEAGALGTWMAHAQTSGADIVLAPLRHQAGELLRNPLTRPGRRRHLDPVRDRLFYRSAPLGLLRRSALDARGLRFTEGAATGGDQQVSAALWTSGQRIDLDRRMPAYVIGADAGSRVTTTRRDMTTLLAPVFALIGGHWADRQPAPVRASLGTKLLRINVLGAVMTRAAAHDWTPTDLAEVRRAVRAIALFAPGCAADLPRADRALLDTVAREDLDPAGASAAVAAHARASRSERLLARRFLSTFGRESVLRRYANYAISRVIR